MPLFLSFVLSPRSSRHPYLLYTSILAGLSSAVPRLLAASAPRARPQKKPSTSRNPRMEASYEVLGDVNSEPASEEDADDVNGEEVRAHVETVSRGYVARTALAALGFAMAVVGLWGDGAPKAAVYVA